MENFDASSNIFNQEASASDDEGKAQAKVARPTTNPTHAGRKLE